MKKKIIMAKIQDTIHSLLYISLSPNCTVSVVTILYVHLQISKIITKISIIYLYHLHCIINK